MDLIQTQIAFFFKQDFKKDFEWFSLSLKEIFGKSNKTLQIPIGDIEPSEIPRLTLNYNGFTINAAKSRMDFLIQDKEITEDVINRVIENLFSKLDIHIGRIGYIKTFFRPSEITELKKALNQELQKKNFSEINLRVNEKFETKKLKCNNIEKIDYGFTKKVINGVPKNVQGQIIQRDINTGTENDITFTNDQMKNIIKEFSESANNRILNL